MIPGIKEVLQDQPQPGMRWNHWLLPCNTWKELLFHPARGHTERTVNKTSDTGSSHRGRPWSPQPNPDRIFLIRRKRDCAEIFIVVVVSAYCSRSSCTGRTVHADCLRTDALCTRTVPAPDALCTRTLRISLRSLPVRRWMPSQL